MFTIYKKETERSLSKGKIDSKSIMNYANVLNISTDFYLYNLSHEHWMYRFFKNYVYIFEQVYAILDK